MGGPKLRDYILCFLPSHNQRTNWLIHLLSHANLCAGPDHISKPSSTSEVRSGYDSLTLSDVELGNATDPYANHLDISIAWVLEKPSSDKFDVFICEAIIDGLIAGITSVAPELAEVDIFEGVELQSKCDEGD